MAAATKQRQHTRVGNQETVKTPEKAGDVQRGYDLKRNKEIYQYKLNTIT